MRRKKYILSDEAIRDLAGETLFNEADTVGGLMEGCPWGFWAAAEEVSEASAAQAAKLKTGQARALFYMRSFYLLGVIRGAEEYRHTLTDKYDLKTIPFSLDNWSSLDFLESLETMKPDEFQRLCALLGLSVQWADTPPEFKRRKR